MKYLNVREPVAVSWECRECGNRHTWEWKQKDIAEGWIVVRCEQCDQLTRVRLARIGRAVWACEWLR